MAERREEGGGRRRRVRLVQLRPEWLAEGKHRFQMGVSFLCPGHLQANHRVELWFLNCCDYGPPKPMPCLYFRQGASLEDLTLSSGLVPVSGKRDLAEHIEVEGHWAGYVFDGWVIDALTDR